MRSVVKTIGKIALKSAFLFAVSKAGILLLKKFNEDGKLEEKAYDVIDIQAEKVKSLAKSGVSKTIAATENKSGIDE